MTIKKKLGNAIRELREHRGLTQGELGRLSELSTSQISNIERGEFAPSIDALEKIARALRVRLPELFAFDLLDGDRARLDQQLKFIALANSLKSTDLELAVGILRLINRRSKPEGGR